MENKTKSIRNNRRDAINRVSIFREVIASLFFREVNRVPIFREVNRVSIF